MMNFHQGQTRVSGCDVIQTLIWNQKYSTLTLWLWNSSIHLKSSKPKLHVRNLMVLLDPCRGSVSDTAHSSSLPDKLGFRWSVHLLVRPRSSSCSFPLLLLRGAVWGAGETSSSCSCWLTAGLCSRCHSVYCLLCPRIMGFAVSRRTRWNTTPGAAGWESGGGAGTCSRWWNAGRHVLMTPPLVPASSPRLSCLRERSLFLENPPSPPRETALRAASFFFLCLARQTKSLCLHVGVRLFSGKLICFLYHHREEVQDQICGNKSLWDLYWSGSLLVFFFFLMPLDSRLVS